MINDPTVGDSSSFLGKKFQNRFRIPFRLFDEYLVPERNVFRSQRSSTIPIESKS